MLHLLLWVCTCLANTRALGDPVSFLPTRDSPGLLKGCYSRPALGTLCFLVHEDFMYVRDSQGGNVVFYLKYNKDTHYFQAMRHHIIRFRDKTISSGRSDHHASPWHVRSLIKRALHKNRLKQTRARRAVFKSRVHSRIGLYKALLLGYLSQELHTRVSKARVAISPLLAQRFHLMALGTLRALGPSFKKVKAQNHRHSAKLYTKHRPGETRVETKKNGDNFHIDKARSLSDDAKLRRENRVDRDAVFSTSLASSPIRPQPTKHSTCSVPGHATSGSCDMRGRSSDCFGMCGTVCWCWSWVCGDCCLHTGCYQHDWCCRRGYLTIHCLCPWCFGFDCTRGYRGYPECLRD
ncbi:uncharacterized protein LOC116604279 [Nematostella vectensis]|uniref:uncharacterized protein LOC116604279 n=1 Tax=Nematostella vectensis TaxID=45351 RepID=UPI002077899E|nr:uncharacterized protein LOC116604279 [Nematostella vectensis]